MGIFKKTEKETIYDDYDDESYRDEELLEEADKEKAANKMFNILNIYETFDKKNKKKHEDRKSGELDEKTKEKQQQAKIEEEKYDHLLNSMQAQTLIKAVEKYGKDEEDRKEIDAIPIELPKEKSEPLGEERISFPCFVTKGRVHCTPASVFLFIAVNDIFSSRSVRNHCDRVSDLSFNELNVISAVFRKILVFLNSTDITFPSRKFFEYRFCFL